MNARALAFFLATAPSAAQAGRARRAADPGRQHRPGAAPVPAARGTAPPAGSVRRPHGDALPANKDGHGPDDLIQFNQSLAAIKLVEELISPDGHVEFQNVQGSSHIELCAALFTNGHAAGVLFKKDPVTGALETDANGDYVPSDTFAVPDRGIILSTGAPADFNGYGNLEGWKTTNFQADGDTDLKATIDASNGQNNSVHDACVLQFEFRCTNSTYVPRVSFGYIWGSEEYLEYVNSTYNDLFGFYLNGEDIAKVPNSDTDSDVVSINNINHNSNARYFNQNDPEVTAEVPYPSIQADGFTDVLRAKGDPKDDPDEWNTIKLAVGDVGDYDYDSWILLESATFTCQKVPTSSPTSAPSDAPNAVSTTPPRDCVPHLVESGNCTKPPTFEECEDAANELGHKWITNPIDPNIMYRPIDHLPGGCFAKRRNSNEKIIKVRYNSHTEPGTNCGQDTRAGPKFTKLCVCCAPSSTAPS